MRKGHDFRDYICPDCFENERDHFRIGDRYGRVLFLKDYASFIKDSMVADLTELDRDMMLSIDIIPVPTDEAVKEVESQAPRCRNEHNELAEKAESEQQFFGCCALRYGASEKGKQRSSFDDLTTRDQRMMFAVITIVHTADTKEAAR